MGTLIKNFFKKYPHAYSIIIGMILLLWFRLLEHYITTPANIIHVKLDNYIPFAKIFIVPYLYWFVYIGIALAYLFFRSKEDFLRLSAFLYIGMSICYTIYMIYPNGQNLRPVLYGNDLLTRMVQFIYATDTPTNCFPSIHVIDAIAVHSAVMNYEGFHGRYLFKASSFVMMCLICMSTVMLKQHSVADVIAGIGVSAVLYMCIYRIDWVAIKAKRKEATDLNM